MTAESTYKGIRQYTVVDANGCWLWCGSVTSEGYGSLRKEYTHRLMYQFVKGAIPKGYHIDHLCRVITCCNPDHLEAVTPRENSHRGIAPNVLLGLANVCHKGHDLNQVGYTRLDGRGRICKECTYERLHGPRPARQPGACVECAAEIQPWRNGVARYCSNTCRYRAKTRRETARARAERAA